MQHIAITEKQIRFATIGLGVVGVVLVGVILFNIFKDQIVGASNTAPTNVTITQITQNSAKITWSTDRETQSVVEYGTTPTSLTFFAPESQRTKQHEVELNLLTPETTYYFQIATGDKRFSNGGVPWTFTTQGKDAQNKDKTASPSATSPQSTPMVTSSAPAPTSSIPVAPAPATPEPTATPSPTPTSGTPVPKDTACVASEYAAALSGYQEKYDQNNDRVVNSADLSLCREKNITPTPTPTLTATPTPTPTPTSTITPTPTP